MEFNDKLGYAEFSENLIYLSGYDDKFLNYNEAFIKDISYFLWEDYLTEHLFIKHYVKMLTAILARVECYGVEW